MTVFIVVLAIIICLHYSLGRNFYHYSQYLAYFMLAFVSMFRYDVGSDYHVYMDLINGTQQMTPYFETTMRAFITIAQKTHTMWWFFAFFGFFTCYFFFRGIEEQADNRYESLIIFMALFYLETLNLIRQGLALSMIFYAFKYVKQRNFKKYAFWVIIATLFHSSAFIAVGLYFIYHHVRLPYMLALDVLAMIFWKPLVWGIVMIPIFSKYAPYLYKVGIQGNGNHAVRVFYLLLFLVSFLVFYFLDDGKDRRSERYLSMISLGLFFPFALGANLGVRLAEYVNVFYLLLIPRLVHCCMRRFPIPRWMYMLPFYGYYILYLCVDYMHSQSYTPFVFYFLKELKI